MRSERFDELCEARGATDEDSRAELIGIDRRTLYRWRRGLSVPSFPNAQYAADVLGTTPTDLWPFRKDPS